MPKEPKPKPKQRGAYIKKWSMGLIWALRQTETAFTGKDFLKANPEYQKAGTVKHHLTIWTEIPSPEESYLVRIRVAVKFGWTYIYMPRPVYEICGHMMIRKACPVCAERQAKRLDEIPTI